MDANTGSYHGPLNGDGVNGVCRGGEAVGTTAAGVEMLVKGMGERSYQRMANMQQEQGQRTTSNDEDMWLVGAHHCLQMPKGLPNG